MDQVDSWDTTFPQRVAFPLIRPSPPPSFSALQDQVTKHSLFYSGLPASMPFSRIMDEIYENVDNVEVRINPRTIKRPKHRHLPPQGPYHVMDPLPSLR